MNTAWVLVFILWPASTASVSFTVENLVSAAECSRVAGEIVKWQSGKSRNEYKCIEVIRK